MSIIYQDDYFYPDEPDDMNNDYDDVWDGPIVNQDEVDEYIASRGDIDKCMNCGRYKYGDQLNAFQVCIKGCVNPNEY